jgi:hypothetical protein
MPEVISVIRAVGGFNRCLLKNRANVGRETMKWREWLISISLIVIGLGCLALSVTLSQTSYSIGSFLCALIRVCLWTFFPVILSVMAFSVFKELQRKGYGFVN